MDLTAINSAMDAAFSAALVNPVKQSPTPVLGDVNQTVQVVTYQAPSGSGFRVIGRIKVGGYVATRVLNSGPDTASERDWPSDGIEAEAESHVKKCVDLAEATILKHFRQITISDGMQKIATREAATIPKTITVATWIQTVKATALAGSTMFPTAPAITEVEVLAE